MTRWIVFGSLVILLFWLVFWLAVPINLMNADIGRHIQNGELLVAAWPSLASDLLTTNFYSYSTPEFAVINHHWGSGMVFYWLDTWGGWLAVHLFYVSLIVLAFILFWDVARRMSGPLAAFVGALMLVPLIAARTEVRPEAFSYAFLGLFTWVLYRVRGGEMSQRWLWLLPLLQIFWVNSHIYFIFGIFVTGIFWGEAVLKFFWARFFKPPVSPLSPLRPRASRGEEGLLKVLSFVLLAVVLASFLNPFGWWGVVYPFTIFSNYGYQIAENKSVWFLENWGQVNPHFLVIKIISVVLVVGTSIFVWWRRSVDIAVTLLGVTFTVLAWLAIRNFTVAGLMVLPLVATYLTLIPWRRLLAQTERYQRQAMVGLAILVAGAATYFYYFDSITLQRQRFGFGLMPEAAQAAEFIKNENIMGPIFNNYDIGGYLIYNLWPREKVFVDNRPEAYPAEFFQEVYIPMQEKDEVWQAQLAKYNFNSIIFYRHDITPWAQQFMIARVQDPEWVPVYVDALTLILVRNNSANAAVIHEYAIPRQVFGVAS